LLTIGGETTTTTTTRNRTSTFVNGVEQPPTTDTVNVDVSESKQGLRGATFGIGGTTFNLFGSFTIRYVW
jgi:hypothetical protein